MHVEIEELSLVVEIRLMLIVGCENTEFGIAGFLLIRGLQSTGCDVAMGTRV